MASSDGDVVVLSVDASENSEYAARFFLDHIYKPGTKVHLVSVKEFWGDAARMMSPGKLEEMIAETNARTHAVIEKFEKMMKPHGIVPSHATPTGSDPWQLICAEAEKQKAAMIVLGSRGMGKIRRTILGSVSDSVIHHSKVPVLVCKMP